MDNQVAKKGLLSRLTGGKKSSCCCNVQIEEISDEEGTKEEATETDTGNNSCCN